MQTRNKLLVDTNVLFALADPDDIHRADALKFTEKDTSSVWLVPDVVLTEVTYLLHRFISQRAVINFLKAFPTSRMQIEPITMPDVKRASEIMEAYESARFDFVDCYILALAERLNVTQICTFDRRDFAIFAPTHCDFLELMP
jgi:predicted nucleic acid-binding protein